MKKIFLTALAICLMSIASVAGAQANYNFVAVSDLCPQGFVDAMGNGSIYQNLRQQGTTVAFTAPSHHPELNDPQNFPGLEVYRSLFGIQGNESPNGEIHFYVAPDNSVFVVRVVNTGDPQLAGAVLCMAMEALGTNQQEMQTLLSTQSVTADTWCQNAGRKIIRVIADQMGNNIMFFGASN